MSREKTSLSVSKRREEARQKKEAQQKMRNMFLIGFLVIATVAIAAYFLTRSGSEVEPVVDEGGERPLAAISPSDRENFYSQYPAMIIDTAKSYEAVITIADKGDMRLTLFDDDAPLTVNSFVFLANQGFYDGLKFHRVIEDFMAQAGDPTGVGSGGPGYTFADETDNGRSFDKRGLLAMANAGPGTNGSQFFITLVETPWLDGNHTIFGELVDGDDVLSSLTTDPTGQAGDEIEKIEIIEQ